MKMFTILATIFVATLATTVFGCGIEPADGGIEPVTLNVSATAMKCKGGSADANAANPCPNVKFCVHHVENPSNSCIPMDFSTGVATGTFPDLGKIGEYVLSFSNLPVGLSVVSQSNNSMTLHRGTNALAVIIDTDSDSGTGGSGGDSGNDGGDASGDAGMDVSADATNDNDTGVDTGPETLDDASEDADTSMDSAPDSPADADSNVEAEANTDAPSHDGEGGIDSGDADAGIKIPCYKDIGDNINNSRLSLALQSKLGHLNGQGNCVVEADPTEYIKFTVIGLTDNGQCSTIGDPDCLIAPHGSSSDPLIGGVFYPHLYWSTSVTLLNTLPPNGQRFFTLTLKDGSGQTLDIAVVVKNGAVLENGALCCRKLGLPVDLDTPTAAMTDWLGYMSGNTCVPASPAALADMSTIDFVQTHGPGTCTGMTDPTCAIQVNNLVVSMKNGFNGYSANEERRFQVTVMDKDQRITDVYITTLNGYLQ